MLKTAAWGYDGKGQRRIERAEDLAPAWRELGGGPAVLEAFVDFAAELSVAGLPDWRPALSEAGLSLHASADDPQSPRPRGRP